jgi:hypothetical protein
MMPAAAITDHGYNDPQSSLSALTASGLTR